MRKIRTLTKKSLDELEKVMPRISELSQRRYIGGSTSGHHDCYSSSCTSDLNFVSGHADGTCNVTGQDHSYVIDEIIITGTYSGDSGSTSSQIPSWWLGLWDRDNSTGSGGSGGSGSNNPSGSNYPSGCNIPDHADYDNPSTPECDICTDDRYDGGGSGGSGSWSPPESDDTIIQGSDGYEIPPVYTPVASDKFTTDFKDLTTIPKQLNDKTCVPATMEFAANIFDSNLSINEGDFHLYHARAYESYIYVDGVDGGNIRTFTEAFFVTSEFTTYQQAIASGGVVMTDFDTGMTAIVEGKVVAITHNVLIIGYQKNGDLIYLDPMSGKRHECRPDQIKGNYRIVLKGTRTEKERNDYLDNFLNNK